MAAPGSFWQVEGSRVRVLDSSATSGARRQRPGSESVEALRKRFAPPPAGYRSNHSAAAVEALSLRVCPDKTHLPAEAEMLQGVFLREGSRLFPYFAPPSFFFQPSHPTSSYKVQFIVPTLTCPDGTELRWPHSCPFPS